MKKITKKFFDPLSITQANMIPVLLDRMQLFGIDFDELEEMYDEWMTVKRCELQKQAQDFEFMVTKPITTPQPVLQERSLNKCKKCGSKVRIYNVNISKCTMVGGGYTKAFQCMNKHCRHTEYK